jgi:hypothetical protein
MSRIAVEHGTPSPPRLPEPEVREPDVPELHVGAWSRERIDGRVALVVGVAWFVLIQVASLLEPTTTHEVPVAAVVLEVAMWAFLIATVVGLSVRRRWGLVASFGGAAVATAASVACPTTGHHAIGAWWFGQMACVLALVAVSVWAMRTPAVSGGGELGEERPRPLA